MVNKLQGDVTISPPEDNVGGQRSKFDVIATILHICLEGSLKNRIIGKGNFSDSMTNHYLSILLYHNMLEASKTEGRTTYRTLEKGRQFLVHYGLMQNLFTKSAAPRASPEDNIRQAPGTLQLQHGKKIMVVDDESDISSAMKVGLQDNGFSVDAFENPLHALESYKPGTYDLLILDVKMPQMSGFELYREIRKIDGNARVCFLTAFEVFSEEFKRVFPSMDVSHFIAKPISMSDLVDQITKLTE